MVDPDRQEPTPRSSLPGEEEVALPKGTPSKDQELSLDMVPHDVQQAFDLVRAQHFVKGGCECLCKGLAGYLTRVRSEGWTEVLRSKVAPEARIARSEVRELLAQATRIHTALSEAIDQNDLELVSQRTHSDLSEFLGHARAVLDRLHAFNQGVYEHGHQMVSDEVRREVRRFGQRKKYSSEEIEKMVGERLGISATKFSDVPYEYLVDQIQIYTPNHSGEGSDLNEDLASFLALGTLEAGFDKSAPRSLANGNYVRFALLSVIDALNDTVSTLEQDAKELLTADNAFFAALDGHKFKGSVIDHLAVDFLGTPSLVKARVGNGGEVTFRVRIPKELAEQSTRRSEELASKLHSLDRALAVSGSTCNVSYSDVWGELCVQLVFRVAFQDFSTSFSRSQQKAARMREISPSDDSRKIELERAASIGEQTTHYTVSLSPAILGTNSYREALRDSLGNLDRHMIYFSKLNSVHVGTIDNGAPTGADTDPSHKTVGFFLGNTPEKDTTDGAAKSTDFEKLLTPHFEWDAQLVDVWKRRGPNEEKGESDTAISLAFDQYTLNNPEMGNLCAEIEKHADLRQCSLIEELYKDVLDTDDSEKISLATAAFLEGVVGLVQRMRDDHQIEGRFQVRLPGARARQNVTLPDGSIAGTSQAIALFFIQRPDDSPFVGGYFSPKDNQLRYYHRDASAEQALVEKFKEALIRVPADHAYRGQSLANMLHEQGVYIPLSLVHAIAQEPELEALIMHNFDLGEPFQSLRITESVDVVEARLEVLFTMPAVFVGREVIDPSTGVEGLTVRIRRPEEFKIAPCSM